jgi:phosphoglycolate phosphatase-like HAD superfamily hydrolase
MTTPRWRKLNPEGWHIKITTSNAILKSIAKTKFTSAQKPLAVVFDLDGTLFDVNHRTFEILAGWAKRPRPCDFPQTLYSRLKTLSLADIGYSVKDSLHIMGFDTALAPNAHACSVLMKEWHKKFFDERFFVLHDKPFANAPEFVHSLEKQGCKILYLSGRSAQRMREGTLEQLETHGFPTAQSELCLKTNPAQDDHLFKAEAFSDFMKRFQIVANFENEYSNIAAMAELAPDCRHVIVDAPHSDKSIPQLDVPVFRISGY